MFLIFFVPLQLKTSDIIVWQNETLNSVHCCRPRKFNLVKESESLVKQEYDFYTNLLQKIESYCFNIDIQSFEVTFDLKCTMIDSKICNFLTDQRASDSCKFVGLIQNI